MPSNGGKKIVLTNHLAQKPQKSQAIIWWEKNILTKMPRIFFGEKKGPMKHLAQKPQKCKVIIFKVFEQDDFGAPWHFCGFLRGIKVEAGLRIETSSAFSLNLVGSVYGYSEL